MTKHKLTERDLREVPVYTVTEAAVYLGLPKATLRSWVIGRKYLVAQGERFFVPLIEIADPKLKRLSFLNLVEVHVLNAIRRTHRIALPKVRLALDYLGKRLHSPRPLANQQFETDGVDLFVTYYGRLMNLTQPGQYAMRELLGEHLRLVRRDPHGVPARLFLFPSRSERRHRNPPIVIDPRVSFGQPILAGTGIRTSALAQRFDAGETIPQLAEDYGRPSEQIEEAIRFERRAA